MKKTYKKYPFEFMFLINDNPIVGRNFPINGFNKKSILSYELKETIDSIDNDATKLEEELTAAMSKLDKKVNDSIIKLEEDVDKRIKMTLDNPLSQLK